MRFRGKSIRRKTGALILVPLLSLVSVWAFASAITVSEARDVLTATSAADALTGPCDAVVRALQAERRQTMIHIADPRRAEELNDLQAATDEAVGRVLARAAGARADFRGATRDRLDAFLLALDSLAQVRDEVADGTIDRTRALEAYNRLTAPGLRFLAAVQPLADVELDRQARAISGVDQAREQLSQEDALMAGALAAGRTTETELRALADLITRRELIRDLYLPDLSDTEQRAHATFWESGPGNLLLIAEEDLLAGHANAVHADEWADTGAEALAGLSGLAGQADDAYREDLDSGVDAVLLRAGVVVGVGLLVIVISAPFALRVGRSINRDLRDLSREAKDAAEQRLPAVKQRLEAGDHVDIETEAPRLEYGPDEIGQVGRALNTLQREAVSAAVERAVTRRGVAEVFVNLARRSQVLLHRQLNLLEALERRTANDEDLADLIRLDHLTTRMRRHAEGLVILSGTAPARQWRKPEQLMDVVRAAVDEVEDFERVEIRRFPPFAVAGGAVADLIHLVAELLENATVFSPPHTAVQVSGERVPHGFTLEIHDRGLGMTPDALADANQRLAESQDFQLSDTDRIGLFVVARLAERHGIRVSLRESPYGGTTAVTLIPGELLIETAEEPQEREPRQEPAARRPPRDGMVGGPVELDGPVGAGPAARPPDTAERVPGHPAEHAPAPESEGPVPLPRLPQRRRTPVLVADHGRTVGRAPGAGPAAGAVPPGDRAAPGAEPTTGAGLPRRVRRQAPDRPAAPDTPVAPGGGPEFGEPAQPGGHPDADAAPDLDAEEVRARMAALQRGWQRGRQQHDPRGDGPPPGARP
ncbi:sensor histidine kinase [Streptomyces sp. NBC_01803]|uniref:sensor histidine kinase n=1 Tax=Streptomyces sp. NBC_01803 TaxID=2975946 RepID=UPI002DDAA1C2|nr:nitrate- and nitrite sensing domain-containing protein [Streptomyces sp. NBC_01803]WSA47250.1 nitrate- and nitrite sensing domain-containing protein [Streptomyces sp. NBC_01803]